MDFIFNTEVPSISTPEVYNSYFVDVIVAMGNSLYAETMCVDGDTLLVGENVLKLVKSLESFKKADLGESWDGILRDKWKVLYVPQFDSNAFELIVNGVNRPEQFALSRLRRSGRII